MLQGRSESCRIGVSVHLSPDLTHTYALRIREANMKVTPPFIRWSCAVRTNTQNRVEEAGRAESGADGSESAAAAGMNGRAENCLHS